MSSPIALDTLPATLKKAVDVTTPAPARMMTARGLAPMPPKDMVTAQYILTFDPETKVAEAAKDALTRLDARIANAILGDTTLNPHVLGYLAVALATRDADVERVLLNPSTPTSAFVEVALVASETICEVIANNQARLLAQPEIARSLTKNPRALKSTVDRVVDFLVRSSIMVEGVAEFEQALLRLSGEERLKAASLVDLPRELLDESFLTPEERAALANNRKLISEDEQGEEEAEERANPNVDKLLRDKTLGEKVALATRGNKAIRSRLIRDSNRVVAMAAITAPTVTELEVVQASQSRVVHQDVVAYIAHQKDWVKLYPVKVGLANNPKCPLPMSMKLVPTLQKKELRALSVSKNVPMGVRTLAAKLMKERNQ
ncbi:MAG: hypothetical protein U1E65_14195 [Myxococcota bacterium]